MIQLCVEGCGKTCWPRAVPHPRSGLSGTAGPLTRLKSGVDLHRPLEICPYRLSISYCWYFSGPFYPWIDTQHCRLQANYCQVGFIRGCNDLAFCIILWICSVGAGPKQPPRGEPPQREPQISDLKIKGTQTHKLCVHSPTLLPDVSHPDLLPLVYPTVEKRNLQRLRPSDTCLGQIPLFEKVFSRTVNPEKNHNPRADC